MPETMKTPQRVAQADAEREYVVLRDCIIRRVGVKAPHVEGGKVKLDKVKLRRSEAMYLLPHGVVADPKDAEGEEAIEAAVAQAEAIAAEAAKKTAASKGPAE